MQGYTSNFNQSNRGSEMMHLNNNSHIYSQRHGGPGMMGPGPGPMGQAMGQAPMGPGMMGPGPMGNQMGGPTIVQNQGAILIRSEQLGACSVNVICPHCNSNIETISNRKFNFTTCLFRIHNYNIIFIVFL